MNVQELSCSRNKNTRAGRPLPASLRPKASLPSVRPPSAPWTSGPALRTFLGSSLVLPGYHPNPRASRVGSSPYRREPSVLYGVPTPYGFRTVASGFYPLAGYLADRLPTFYPKTQACKQVISRIALRVVRLVSLRLTFRCWQW